MNNRPLTLKTYLIWVVAALFYGYEVCLQISPSVMIPDLMKAFNINAALTGNLAAFYFYSYTLMQIPSGLLLDIFGPRKVMLTAFLLCALGAFLFGIATKIYLAQLGRLVIGLGASFAIVGTFKIISIWFPLNRFALMSGLTVMIGMIGAIGAGAPLAFMVEHMGWRNSLFVFTFSGFILFFVAWFLLHDNQSQQYSNQALPPANGFSLWQTLKEVLTKKQNWIVASYGGLMFAPTSAFAGLWGVSFIMSAYNVSRPVAGSAISMVFIGWIIGSPLFGKISDTLGRRKPTLLFASVGSLVSFYLTVYVIGDFHLVFTWLFLLGLSSSAFLPCFSIIQEINSRNTNATALGYMNMMNMVGGTILQPVIGIFLDKHWGGKMLEGVRYYSLANFQKSLEIIVLMFIVAAILYFFIEEPGQEKYT